MDKISGEDKTNIFKLKIINRLKILEKLMIELWHLSAKIMQENQRF